MHAQYLRDSTESMWAYPYVSLLLALVLTLISGSGPSVSTAKEISKEKETAQEPDIIHIDTTQTTKVSGQKGPMWKIFNLSD